jgi:hypothetical protein
MYAYKPKPQTYDPYALDMQFPGQSTTTGTSNGYVATQVDNAVAQGSFPTLQTLEDGYLPDLITFPTSAQADADGYLPDSFGLAPSIHDDPNGYSFGESSPSVGISQAALQAKLKVAVPSGPWAHSAPGKWAPATEPPTPKDLKTKARGEQYANEDVDASSFRGAPQNATKFLTTPNAECAHVQTRMFSTSEAEDHAVSVKEGALMHQGVPLNTATASGTGTWANGGEGRYLYAKSKEGQVRAVDAWKEHLESPMSEAPTAEGKVPTNLQMVNHSTLLGGKEAQGAGEIRADHGKHVVMSDRSGHYKPDNQMLYNSVKGLVDEGLAPEGTTVEMTDKSSRFSGIVPKDMLGQAQPYDPKFGDLQVGALEFMSYGGDLKAEERMRQARMNRLGLNSQISTFDKKTLTPTATNDRSAPKRESVGESIFRGDQPSIKNRASLFVAKEKKEREEKEKMLKKGKARHESADS